jgi:hypothetical protein
LRCLGTDLRSLLDFTKPIERAGQRGQQGRIVWRVSQRKLIIGASKIITTHRSVAGSNAGECVGTCWLLPLKLSERLERKTGVPER